MVALMGSPSSFVTVTKSWAVSLAWSGELGRLDQKRAGRQDGLRHHPGRELAGGHADPREAQLAPDGLEEAGGRDGDDVGVVALVGERVAVDRAAGGVHHGRGELLGLTQRDLRLVRHDDDAGGDARDPGRPRRRRAGRGGTAARGRTRSAGASGSSIERVRPATAMTWGSIARHAPPVPGTVGGGAGPVDTLSPHRRLG